jgi:prolyl oligopeptidase
MTIIEAGDARGKLVPTMMTAYGAYGTVLEPAYSPHLVAWLEQGGRYVFCHARGGGDLGESWHRAAMQEKKRVSVDDAIACAEDLLEKREVDRNHLAFHGRSAGGIIASTLLADRRDLFGAIAIEFGVTEATRMEHTAGGPANVPEFGSSATKEGFEALLQVDGYNRLTPGMILPRVLVTTGIRDNRVPAWMPAKFVARLRRFAVNAEAVDFRVDFDDGHGLASTAEQRAAYSADLLAFARSGMAAL